MKAIFQVTSKNSLWFLGRLLLTHVLGEMPQTQCPDDPIPRRVKDFSDFSHELGHFHNFQRTKSQNKTRIPSTFVFSNT